MSLRLKSLLIFSGTVVLLFGMVAVLSKVIIERQFTNIEMDTMHRNAERFSVDLQKELQPILSTVGNWAAWDELYEFMGGKNPDFPDNNLSPEDLEYLRLDFLALWRQDRSLCFLQNVQAHFAESSLTPKILTDALLHEGILPQKDITQPASGPMLVGDQIVLVSSAPIVRSTRMGEPIGTIIGGKILTQQRLQSLEQYTDYHIAFVPPPPGTPESGGDRSPVVQIHGEKEIIASVPIIGLDGRMIAIANLTGVRHLSFQADRTVRIFLIALACSAGILLFVVWYLFDSAVILPIQRLAAGVMEATTKGQLPSNLGFSSGNELASLARRIEEMSRAVEHAEASYRAIVEDQTEFIFRYQADGNITFANEALCRYLGKSRRDLLGSNARNIVAVEDSPVVSTALGQLSTEAPVVTLNHRVNTPDGSIAWFRRTDRAIFDDRGKLREYQCVARDITQTHLSQELLKASEIRYRRLFETAADGILIIKQTDHTITDANLALCRILDCKRSDLIEHTIESISPLKLQKTRRVLAQLFDDASPIRKGEIVLRQRGVRCYLEVTASMYEMEGESIVQLNFRDISKRKQASDDLRQLSGHLLRMQDEERRRIARELHDSTAQNLTAIQMAATQLESSHSETAQARSTVHEIVKLANLCSREIRTISYLLHPPLLDEVGLIFALRWYVDGFMTRTETIVRLDVPDLPERLPSDIETSIFRVVQEGLSNIHRHSGSKRAWIRLAVNDDMITLEIRDEGKGLNLTSDSLDLTASPIIGVGIAGMRERLRQLNGSLTVESSSKGTLLCAKVPLKFDEDRDD